LVIELERVFDTVKNAKRRLLAYGILQETQRLREDRIRTLEVDLQVILVLQEARRQPGVLHAPNIRHGQVLLNRPKLLKRRMLPATCCIQNHTTTRLAQKVHFKNLLDLLPDSRKLSSWEGNAEPYEAIPCRRNVKAGICSMVDRICHQIYLARA
jgi:membrane-bound lytic murein transglycosylase MltF